MIALIVEDEVLVRKGLAMGLDWKALGFEKVYEAGNGVEAMELLKTISVDFMLTDIVMPKMDGLELIKETSRLYPNVAMVVLSCMNDGEYIREAMKYHRALDYIPKLSISTEELGKSIKNIMSNYKKTTIKGTITETALKETITYFQIEDEVRLQELLNSGDKDGLLDALDEICDRVSLHQESISLFPEWVEIYASMNHSLKLSGSNILDIAIAGQSCYGYLESSRNFSELKKRLREMASIVIDRIIANKHSQYGKEITAAILYIESHFRESVKLREVASFIGLNESYLSSLFKSTVGISFSDYLNKTRLSHAKELLKRTDLAIYEIAHQVGYSSESYFSRIFKQYENMSPKAYKKIK